MWHDGWVPTSDVEYYAYITLLGGAEAQTLNSNIKDLENVTANKDLTGKELVLNSER